MVAAAVAQAPERRDHRDRHRPAGQAARRRRRRRRAGRRQRCGRRRSRATILVDQVDKQFVPKVTAVAGRHAGDVPEQRQRSPPGLFVLAGQALRVAAVRGRARAADPLRQAGRRRARLQHPRLDGRLRLRVGVAVFREDRRQTARRRSPTCRRAPTSCASGIRRRRRRRKRRARPSTRRPRPAGRRRVGTEAQAGERACGARRLPTAARATDWM